MKKLFGILILVLFSTTVFGQADYFNDESVVISERQEIIRNGGINGVSNFYYNFVTNNKKYLLAYDADEEDWKRGREYTTDPRLTRNLILYRFDGVDNWVKASNVVQIDYEDSEPHIDYGTHKSYGRSESKIKKRGLGSGMVKVLESGCVVMVITNTYRKPDKIHTYSQETKSYTCCDGHKNGIVENLDYNYNAVVIFVPNGDKTYTATRFEPEDKKNNDFSMNLEINEIDNKIMIDINTYHQAKDESKADTCVVFQGERDKVKKCFDIENYATLLFKIQPDNKVKVLASGKLNLVEKR
jgi:hypothetical protein